MGRSSFVGFWARKPLSYTSAKHLRDINGTQLFCGILGKEASILYFRKTSASPLINAGGGGSLLIGGDGNDRLLGGLGRDVMIAGESADNLLGNSNDDILVAGYTKKDSRSTAGHEAFWCEVLKEWNSGNSFAARVANLGDGSGDKASGRNNLTSEHVAEALRDSDSSVSERRCYVRHSGDTNQ